MGLDMSAHRVGMEEVIDDLNFNNEEGANFKEIFYWRKNRYLHNWMEKLYREKGGYREFNCEDVRLTEEDLNRLEKDIMDGTLSSDYSAEGFFFGSGDYSYYEQINDLDFIKKARRAIKDGDAVYYSSGW